MNRIDGKKIQSLLQTIIRFFRGERKPGLQANMGFIPKNDLGDFAVSLKYAMDSDTRKSIVTALIDAERHKAEAIERARHFFLS